MRLSYTFPRIWSRKKLHTDYWKKIQKQLCSLQIEIRWSEFLYAHPGNQINLVFRTLVKVTHDFLKFICLHERVLIQTLPFFCTSPKASYIGINKDPNGAIGKQMMMYRLIELRSITVKRKSICKQHKGSAKLNDL